MSCPHSQLNLAAGLQWVKLGDSLISVRSTMAENWKHGLNVSKTGPDSVLPETLSVLSEALSVLAESL